MTDEEAYLDDHSRTIIHIDIDCFYAQVELIKNPNLKTVPFAVHQKNYVVTSNHIARKFGVKKMSLISEAKNLCPNLILINGEDLHDYRHTSYKVTELLSKSFDLVERLALDENFIDVSKQVALHLGTGEMLDIVGNSFGDNNDVCDCGCSERLKIGTAIAQQLRDLIKSELNLTTCAGIAHNKLLAKIVGSTHRPDQQTVVFPNNAVELMLSQQLIFKITGIGQKLSEQLSTIGIHTVKDLQTTNLSKVSMLLGSNKAKHIYNLSFGLDHTPVKTSGRPQSIGIEDCKPISLEKQVIEQLKELLRRLLILVAEDGRIPKSIKLTVRQIDTITRIGNRKTKQSDISTALFNSNDLTKLPEATVMKIISLLMQMFNKLVNTKKTYHLTLLGLSFTKFIEKPSIKNTLTNFLDNGNFKFILDTKTSINDVEFNQPAKKHKSQKEGLKVVDSKCNTNENSTSLKINCPTHFDEEVFRQLPNDIQAELLRGYKETKENACTSKLKKRRTNSILNYLIKQ